MRASATFWLLAGMLFGLTGCGGCSGTSGPSSPTGSKVIRIVSSLPRTGSAKGQTDTIVNGIQMALDEAGHKVGEFTIEYSDLDDASASAGQWTAELETANADKAKADPDCMIYIGTYNSGAAKVSMPILNRAGIIMISPANTWPGFTKPGLGDPGEPEVYRPSGKRNYVRVVPADDLQALRAAQWAKEMGVKSVFVIDDTEVYGAGIARLFDTYAEEAGIEVLGHESIDAKSQEFKSLMTRVKAKNPDLVYFGGTTQSKGGQIAKDMVAVGLDAKLMAPDGCYENAFIKSAGADNVNDRCFITFGGLPPEELSGVGKEFVEKYLEKYGSDPEAYAIYGYECGRVALEAIRKAGKKDRNAIREACLAIKDFDGALGKWSFDENGDTSITTISGNTVKDGKFLHVKVLGASEEKSE